MPVGCSACQGPVGQAGPKGPVGAKGAPGSEGLKGESGVLGPLGEQVCGRLGQCFGTVLDQTLLVPMVDSFMNDGFMNMILYETFMKYKLQKYLPTTL